MTEVVGYWRPIEGATPSIGDIGVLHKGRELKIEVLCNVNQVNDASAAIRNVHPYEEPVINFIPLMNLATEPF